jgi:cytochrome c2
MMAGLLRTKALRPAVILLGLVIHGASGAAQDSTLDPHRGAKLIATLGCGACHSIPGISGARGLVGPPLDNIGARTIIAGLLPNTPENLARWIEAPQSVVPGNAMPNIGLNARDAADIAAYLDTLRN